MKKDHQEIKAFIRQLETPQSSMELLIDVMLDISFALHQVLPLFGIERPANLQTLIALLQRNFIQVDTVPGRRLVRVCEGMAVLEVKTANLLRPEIWQQQGVFAGETAAAVWQRGGREEAENPWILFSAAQWHVMLLDWLSIHLENWRDDAGQRWLTPEQARQMAKQVCHGIPALVNVLRVLLLDALGCPRNLVAYLVRIGCRFPQVPPWMESAVTACWSGRHSWPGMSRKLFPLAVVAVKFMGCDSLEPHRVRQCYLEAGLSRNAWAHLMRLPSASVLSLAMAVKGLPDTVRPLFLQELSFWLSRFGNQYRYYPLKREQLVMALLWMPYESLRIRSGHIEGGVLEELLTLDMFRESVIIHRLDLGAEQYERMQLLLLALSHEAMRQDVPFEQTLGRLSTLMDWFVADGCQLPVRWFRQPFSRIWARSEQWHEQLQVRLREQARQRQERLLEDWLQDIPAPKVKRSWQAAVERLEEGEVLFEALTSESALEAEGLLMQHCVATYSDMCAKGHTLIYAVSRHGKRLGTMEIYRDRGLWRVLQFKGRRNRELMGLTRPGQPLCEPVARLLGEIRRHSGSFSC